MNVQRFKFETMIMQYSFFKRFRMPFFLFFLIFSITGELVYAEDYGVDKTSSKVKWEAKKVTGKHNGSILIASGAVTVENGVISGGSVSIDMKSFVDEDLTDSGMKMKLIGHLSSDDFFAVEKFPESKIVVKKVTPVSGDDYRFTADLTIKGITNPVEFTAKVKLNDGTLLADGMITVNRTLYGIKYGSGSFFQGLGDKMIYDDFTIAFNLVARK